MTTFHKSISSMGSTFLVLTMCLYLSEVAVSNTTIRPKGTAECKMALEIGANAKKLYLDMVQNKKVLNKFVMRRKEAFYITPPYEENTKSSKVNLLYYEDERELKKKLLEEFTMKRKEAFYITPPYETRRELESKWRSASLSADTHTRSYTPNDTDTCSDKENTKKNQKNLRLPIYASVEKKTNADKKSAQSYDYDITFSPKTNEEKPNILQKETPIIVQKETPIIVQKENLTFAGIRNLNIIQNGFPGFSNFLRKIDFNDYDKAIKEIKDKQKAVINILTELGADAAKIKKYNDEFAALLQTVAGKKKQDEEKDKRRATTVMIMIDETDVRKRLKNDPFVQRILKMVKKRKDDYFRKAAAAAAEAQTR